MKRIILISMAVSLCLLMAAPAMALDVDFSGQYRVRGYYIDKEYMGNTQGLGTGATIPTDTFDRSYMDMRFRLQTIFKVNENISVTTRFDALDNTKWGDKYPIYSGSNALWSNDPASGNKTFGTSVYDRYPDDQANVDFDRAYATIKTPIGGFLFGRMKDNSWGTPFGDTEGDGDRLVYVLPIKNLIFAAVYEKAAEVDSDPGNRGTLVASSAAAYGSDQDNDKVFLSGTYRSEAFTAGLLYGYYRFNSYIDYGSETHTQNWREYTSLRAITDPAAVAAGEYQNPFQLNRPLKANAHLISPYITGKWGDFELQAEGTIAFGKADYTYDKAADPLGIKFTPTAGTPAQNGAATLATNSLLSSVDNGGKDRDINLWQAMVEGTYHFGPLAVSAGYAGQSGDTKYRGTEDKITGFGFIEQSGDWHKLWILNGGNRLGDDNGMYTSLGGYYQSLPVEELGNSGNQRGFTTLNGFQTFWFGLDYGIMDNMMLGGLVGFSQADKVQDVPAHISALNPAFNTPANKWEKDYGTEFDVNFVWDIYENLTWRMTYAYLKAGDYWKQGNANAELKDPYTFYTNLSVNF